MKQLRPTRAPSVDRRSPAAWSRASGARALVVLLAALIGCGGPAASAPARDADKAALDARIGAAVQSDAPEEDLVVPVGPADPVRGNRDALVTIVVFTDFQCPFCSRFAATLEKVRTFYGPEDVRIVLKNEPLEFHEYAAYAAVVGQGVFATKGADAFFRFHDAAFANQRGIGPDAVMSWASAAGADPQVIRSGVEQRLWEQKVQGDLTLADKLGARGTPSAFINGERLSGAQPFEKVRAVIDAQLAKAKAKVAAGTPRLAVYRAVVAENYVPPPPDDGDADEPREDTTTVWKVPVAGAPARGPSSALVTIVEFSDFQCPFCKKAEATLAQIQREYGEKVRVVWRDEPLPFHPRATPAARLARFARGAKGDAGFWDVHDRLFDAQPKLEDEDLEGVARGAGLDVKKAMAAVRGESFDKAIAADHALAENVSVAGTPHFFINGRRLVGARPIEDFRPIIDAEITRAEGLLAKGITKAGLYDALIKDGANAKKLRETRTPPAVGKTAPFMGPANAKVVIQQWSDFQCPFCARVESTLADLMKAYPSQVKVVWRDKPLSFHPYAKIAAEAAREAYAQKGNAGFDKMRKLLFAHPYADGGLDRDALDGYAKQVGLDVKKFDAALDTHAHVAAIEADDAAGKEVGINGTPGFLIGPYLLSGAQPVTKFKALVEDVLHPEEPASAAKPGDTAPPRAAGKP